MQVHKDGTNFMYFSRSLKPMKEDQVENIAGSMPKACPSAETLILDGEVLLVSRTGAMLGFGSLGTEKRKEHPGAHVCLFIFDILYLNGRSLLNEPFEARRRLLEEIVTPVPGLVQLSSAYMIHSKPELDALMAEAVEKKLEGEYITLPACPCTFTPVF